MFEIIYISYIYIGLFGIFLGQYQYRNVTGKSLIRGMFVDIGLLQGLFFADAQVVITAGSSVFPLGALPFLGRLGRLLRTRTVI